MGNRVDPNYVARLAEVRLTDTHQESLKVIIADSRKNERQKFFGTRDVILDALLRQHVGDAAYLKLHNSATEKAKTVLLLAKQAP